MSVAWMVLGCGWFPPGGGDEVPSGTWTVERPDDSGTPTTDSPGGETGRPETGDDSAPGDSGDSGDGGDGCHPDPPGDSPDEGLVRIALIGDFGDAGSSYCSSSDYTYRVSRLVAAFDPTMIFTAGDNNYNDGAAETIDANIGQYYWPWIDPYLGDYPEGPPPEDTADTAPDNAKAPDTAAAPTEVSEDNRFWPSLGNHDWYTGTTEPYTDYFTLPGNERYYTRELAEGLELFVIDSDDHEPDGITADSPQAQWLQGALAASDATWKIVVFHHPSFSSGLHGDTFELQWPLTAWGADLVLSGHDHTFERMIRDGIPYVIEGRGGRSLYYLGSPVAGSRMQYNAAYGASVLDFDGDWLHLRALTIEGGLIDELRIHVDAASLEEPLTGSTWRYADHDAAEESGWTELGFDDASWKTGEAPLGYGLSGIVTEVSWGEPADEDTGDTAEPGVVRAITSWYRQDFLVPDAGAYVFAELQIACDDGCIAYLNGTEIARRNMPSKGVDEETAASSTVYTDTQTKFGVPVDPALLSDGPNVLAIELHQADTASSDAWLDADLVAYRAEPVLETGASWRWAFSPAEGFEAPDFDDSAWSAGATPIGAGVEELATEVEPGEKPPIGAGFRAELTVDEEPEAWLLRMRRDDGARVFVDGEEVWRSNLAYGELAPDTPAPWAIGSASELRYVDTWLPGEAIGAGKHALAVELHQASGKEDDLVFDLQIHAVDLSE